MDQAVKEKQETVKEACGSLTQEEPVDILNRQGIVDNMMQLLNVVSESNSSCTFALDGKWGTGKSFVLNMLEKELLNYQAGNRYLVFRYNCWKYDYYEEPLFAIVAAMLDSTDRELHLLSKEIRSQIEKGVGLAKSILKQITSEISKNKLGIDVTNLDCGKKDSFDSYFLFNQTLEESRKELEKLTRDYTIVVIVDELDRCLPNYAIKVLERLHHLFYDMKKCAVVIAVDKSQLEHTVKQVFGEGTETDQYLKKFINFEMQLDTGKVQEKFSEKYPEYYSMFTGHSAPYVIADEFNVEEFLSILFSGIPIRIQERLMERITVVHRIVFPNKILDYSYMCTELMWLVVAEFHQARDLDPIRYNSKFNSVSILKIPGLLEYMLKNIGLNGQGFVEKSNYGYNIYLPTTYCIPSIAIYCFIGMYESFGKKIKGRAILNGDIFGPDYWKNTLENLKKVDNLLQLIK